ncbi:uncharacterized protein LOC133721035 isoform X1 [Rosa rugosa]|uniref:uncharacterized protein LOC133721035 isoform X1 n=1 Tax=Rosa rugosa TaxID=74645 RepID=UPI002B4074FE|nr:uncharacterized protein LOC133721035 isoform X1 [Rosa rugosa]XP_062003529.1 uncharacterized protein LOC133721035 isoform X1 [Rosa rugosa]XP_062003530.1 uncharacterized protein LOC133721035 isoform X1 [Rosa rugosa]
MWWLLRRTTLLRRSFPPPEKMSFRNDTTNSPATPGGNSVISLSPASAANVGNRDCQILKVGSIPILIYDSFGNVVKRPIGFGVTSGFSDKKQCSSLSDGIRFDEMRSKVGLVSGDDVEDACASSTSESVSEREHERWSTMPDWKSQLRECSLPTEFGMKRKHHHGAEKRHSVPRTLKYAPVTKSSGLSKRLHRYEPFDICLDGRNSALQASFHARMMEAEESVEFANPEQMVEFKDPIVLRPGMVLLKNYVSLSEQVEIVKTCRELGLGPGGFYQPVFQHGRKLQLQMMCLGRNWDPETRIYEDIRPIDGTRPPGIPNEFSLLVERAIQEAHAHLKDKIRCSSVEKVLPLMTPDICIANFYTTSGRLGLHQDRDESKESLQKRLPVVSISVGDSADFLYGDQRDIDKAESVVLDSGDVLIFGGRSRHIFHGVTSIIPNSAPNNLLKETRLRPGRLNLTFRQY